MKLELAQSWLPATSVLLMAAAAAAAHPTEENESGGYKLSRRMYI